MSQIIDAKGPQIGSFSDLQGLVVEASAESPSQIEVSLWDPATRQIYDSTIEFEEEHGVMAYGIYYLDPAGRRREVYVDAATGKILEDKRDD